MTKVIDGTIGVNLTRVSDGTTTDGADAEFKLGQTCRGDDGTLWMYVQAGAAITQYRCVAIDENFQAVHVTSALAAAGHQIGFAQVAFADNQFGWVALEGTNILCWLLASCAPDVQLYTSGTAGALDDTSTGTLLRGVVAVPAATATAEAHEIIARGVSGTATP